MLRETSWNTNGHSSMPVRRVSKEDTDLGKISVLEYWDILEPEPGSEYRMKMGEWKELPKHLSDLANSSITKAIGRGYLNSFVGTDTETSSNGRVKCVVENKKHFLKDEECDFKSSIHFSRFLRRANLVSKNALQSGIGLPKNSRFGMQEILINGQQAGAAVGCYFGNTTLAESAPNLGVLMGNPSREVVEESLAMSNLSALIVAVAFQDKIPEGRPVNASFDYRYEWESPESRIENTRAEIYAHISDCKTKETYVMFPLAYATQDINQESQKIIKRSVRTSLAEVKDKDFVRTSTAEFYLSS